MCVCVCVCASVYVGVCVCVRSMCCVYGERRYVFPGMMITHTMCVLFCRLVLLAAGLYIINSKSAIIYF